MSLDYRFECLDGDEFVDPGERVRKRWMACAWRSLDARISSAADPVENSRMLRNPSIMLSVLMRQS